MKIKSIRVLNCNYNDRHVYMDETGFGLQFEFKDRVLTIREKEIEDAICGKTIAVLLDHSVTHIEEYESTKGSINNEQ